jgi:flagellar biosynthesis protein FliQ
MSQQLAIETIREALMMAMWMALPLLAVMFVVGIFVSLLQIVTSIQDPTFGTVPRLAAFFAVLFLALPWLIIRMVDYTHRLLENLAKYAH